MTKLQYEKEFIRLSIPLIKTLGLKETYFLAMLNHQIHLHGDVINDHLRIVATMDELAELTGFSNRTIKRWVKKLYLEKIIFVEKQESYFDNRNRYAINHDKISKIIHDYYEQNNRGESYDFYND